MNENVTNKSKQGADLYLGQVKNLTGRIRTAAALRLGGSEPHLRVVAGIPGMITMEEADFLYRLAASVSTGCIVEVGSYRGRSTTALALGAGSSGRQIPVFAVDPHEERTGAMGGQFGAEDRAQFFRSMLSTKCYRIVRLVNLSSETVSPGWSSPVGLVWLDGDHTHEAVRRDVEAWMPHLVSGGLIAFHDAQKPDLGPAMLIEEMVRSGDHEELEGAGSIRVIRRRGTASV